MQVVGLDVHSRYFSHTVTTKLFLSLTLYLSNVEGDVDRVEEMVDGACGNHQPGVDGSTDNTTKRIPKAMNK